MRDQADLVPHRGKHARPMVCRAASLNADQAWCSLEKNGGICLRCSRFTSTWVQASSTPCLNHALRQVQSNRRDRHCKSSVPASRNRSAA